MLNRSNIPLLLLLPLLLIGCKSAPCPRAHPRTDTTPAATYPSRPTTPPAPSKSSTTPTPPSPSPSHPKRPPTTKSPPSSGNSATPPAPTPSTNSKSPRKQVDADGSTVWFHIYRGPKCAPEKYAPGEPPCGASYHAAGDYTSPPRPRRPGTKASSTATRTTPPTSGTPTPPTPHPQPTSPCASAPPSRFFSRCS
jgi:hypothetical protein